MQKLIFLRIGLVLNLLEDAVGRLARAQLGFDLIILHGKFNIMKLFGYAKSVFIKKV